MNNKHIRKTYSLLMQICFMIFSLSAQAQESYQFSWSKQFTTNYIGLANARMTLATEKGFVVQSVEPIPNQVFGKHIYLTSFNAESKVIAETKMLLPKIKGNEATYLETIETNDQLLIFTSLPVRGANNTLLVQTYDFGGSVVSAPIELVSLPIEKLSNSGDFLIAISEDKQTLGVVAHFPRIRKGNEQLKYLVFDTSLKSGSEKEYTLAYPSAKNYEEQFFVTNKGKAKIIKYTDTEKAKPKTFYLKLEDDGTVATRELSAEDFYIMKSQFVETSKGAFIAGFATNLWKPAITYNDKKSKYAFLYNCEQKQLASKHSWSEKIVKKLLGKGFTNLEIKDVLFNDNAIHLVGEEFKMEELLIPDKSFEYDYKYEIGPQVVVKFDYQGQVIYDYYVKGKEFLKNNMHQRASLTPVLSGKGIYLYNNVDLVSISGKKFVFGAETDFTLNEIALDAQGNPIEMPIYDKVVGGKNASMNFCPSTLLKVNDNTFYIKAYGRSNQAFGKMTLKNEYRT